VIHARATYLFVLLFAAAAPWSIAAAQSAAVALALVACLTPRRPEWRWFHWALLLFVAAQALSIPLGVHPERSLRCFRGSWVVSFGFIFWWALRTQGVRRAGVAVWIASSALAGLYGLLQHLQGWDYVDREPLEPYPSGGFLAVGTLGSHLTYAGVLLPAAFVALGAAFHLERRRWLWALAAAAIFAGVVVSYTRTAWIGAVAGLACFILSIGRRTAWIVAGLAVGAAALLALLQPSFASRALSSFDLDDPRWRLWRTAWRIIGDHPLTGAGLGSFKTLFPTYRVPGDYLSTIHPHSDLLNVWVEAGLVGAVAFLLIWVAFAVEARPARSADRLGRGIVIGAVSGVAALLAAGFGQCYFTDEEVAQVWMFVTALGLREATGATAAPRPLRRFTQGLKAISLPLLARLLSPSVSPSVSGAAPGEASGPAPPRQRWLAIRPDDRLGNLLLARPFLSALRAARPGDVIALLSGDEFTEVTADWTELDERWAQPKRRQARAPWRFISWARSLRRAGWDTTIDLSNPGTHSYSAAVLALIAGAATRVGFDDPRKERALTIAAPTPDPRLPAALAPLALLRALGLPAAASVPVLPKPIGTPSAALVEFFGAPTDYVVVHLGGRDEKAWPMSAWETFLERAEAAIGHRLVVVAGPEERARLDALRARVRPGVGAGQGGPRFAPALSLSDLSHLLAGAKAFVGCDSGVMHLATALGAPCVALFFRSDPWRYAPLGAHHRTVLLANPYQVEPSLWARPVEGLARGRLVLIPLDEDASRAGRPADDARAVEAVVTALVETLTEGRV